MSKVLIEESNLTAIASAIRQKLGVQTTYKPGQMATAIQSIAPQPVLETKSIVANGTYTPSTGKDGFSQVTVNVPNSYAAGDEGKVVSSGVLVAQTARASEITSNGTYDTTNNNSVTVNVSGGGSGFVPDTYSQYLNNVFDTGVAINSDYRIEVSFYANAYINDGHIVGQSYSSSGDSFHLTTFSDKWHIGGITESNFAPNDNYPLSDADIIYSAKTGEVKMNGILASTSFTMPNQASYTYKLNTRGGSVSTTGKYKYKYVKVYDANDDLLCHWEFGHLVMGNTILYLAHDIVSNAYKNY